MAKTKKELMTFGFALFLLLGSSLVLYHVFTNNFKTTGQWWRGRVMNSFVTKAVTVDTIYKTENESFGKTASNHIHEVLVVAKVHFDVNKKKHTRFITLETFPWPEFEKADNYLKNFKKQTGPLTIIYDPADPNYIVKSRDEIPGFFTSTAIILLNLIVLIVLFALFCMGAVGVYAFFKKAKYRAPNQPISAKRKLYLMNKYFPKPPVTTTVIPERETATKLSGDTFDDYYSGALGNNALQCWHGFYCEIFLFVTGVIVAFQEDKGYYIRDYSLNDIIEKKYKTHLMESFFDAEEQELEQSFFDAVANVISGSQKT